MLKFAKFIGANTDFATAQAFLFPRFTEGSNDPVFGLVISGEGDDIFVSVRQKILNLEEHFSAPFERVTDKLHELLEMLKTEFKQVENLKLSLFYARENLFYVLQKGTNLVEILSEGKRLQIITQDFPQEKIISGFIKSGDRILVLSSKIDGSLWSEEVVSEVFAVPLQSVADAEVIFAKDEQRQEKEQDLAGIKNIQPVAFVLIENETESVKPSALSKKQSAEDRKLKAESGFKVNIDFSSVFLSARKIIRQALGALRQINERVLLVNKKILIAGVLIILVSVISLGGYFYMKSEEAKKNTRTDNLITLIEASLNKADSQKDSDSKGAREELKKAAEKLKEVESLESKNQKVLDVRRKFDDKSAQVLKIYKDFELDLFMSLNLIRENFQTKRISFSVDRILLLDELEKSLVTVGMELKSPDVLAGKTQLGDGKIGVINGSNAFVYSQDKGIVHIDLDTGKASVVSGPDALWGQIEDIFGFSGNVYALDTGKNMIWKYTPIQSGFSQKQEYLRGQADLSRGKRLKIDYSVWVLTDEPDILKFTAGNSDFYAVSGLDEPLTQIDGLFVTEDLDSVFILDKSKNRILVTKKNGEYLAQYIKEDLGKVDDFFVDEEKKFIYLLIENKIYKTPLR